MRTQQAPQFTGPAAVLDENQIADSRRMLLPEFTDITSENLHLVNRDGSLRQLVDVHHSNFVVRALNPDSSGVRIPLIHCISGLGKTLFSKLYLSLLARSGFLQKYSGDRDNDFVNEMLTARTLYVSLTRGELVDAKTRESKLMRAILRAARGSLVRDRQVDKNEFTNLRGLLTTITGVAPVVIVLESIGRAFSGNDIDLKSARDLFCDFLQRECDILLRAQKVYVILCGSGGPLSLVGLHPDDCQSTVSEARVGITRIKLNPIRPEYILEILARTTRRINSTDVPLAELVPKPIEKYAQDLYAATNGHPRSLWKILSSRNLENIADQAWIWVELTKSQISLYPREIRELYNHHKNRSRVDLRGVLAQENGCNGPTLEFVASQIQAGYDGDVSDALIFIPPIVERELEAFLTPLSDYLQAWNSIDVRFRGPEKERVFGYAVLKWFGEVFTPNKAGSTRERLGEYLPGESMLVDTTLTIDQNKLIPDPGVITWIQGPDGRIGERVVDSFRSYLDAGECQVYIPPTYIDSPDVVFLPRDEYDTGSRYLLAVSAKYPKRGERNGFGHSNIEAECRKFRRIFDQARDSDPSFRGVLFILSAGPFGNNLNLDSSNPSGLWTSPRTHMQNTEVIIVNLSTVEKREEFFSKVVPRDAEVLGIIEKMIESLSE